MTYFSISVKREENRRKLNKIMADKLLKGEKATTSGLVQEGLILLYEKYSSVLGGE